MFYENEKLIDIDINKEMKKAYIDYAMSVIVGRALPDVRDGLKPVHRRILYTMYEDGLTQEKAYRKSATTVGAVLGRYHPHGDASVYDAMVRMAQDFSLRYPLIDGRGNFGSVDGDGAAAYRYTEARLASISNYLLDGIEKETVGFMPNYDDKHEEPVVLPVSIPNLLVNGSMGIAVGMATNIPPHNLSETVDGILEVLDNPEADLNDIMEHIKAPDFPTGGIIVGRAGIRQAYHTGRGRAVVRARCEIEEKDGKFRIIVTEIPYKVNKSNLMETIADRVKDKRVEGITHLRDESDRNGMKIVMELRRDANPQVVLNQLYKHTQLQDNISIILLALVNNEPKVLSLREIIDCYIDFRKEVIRKRTEFDLRKAREREHILEGLKIATDFIDEVIKIIRASKSIQDSKIALIERFTLSDIQAQAIVDMRLGRLSALEREKIENELKDLLEKISYYEAVLSSDDMVKGILKEELENVKKKLGDARRTELIEAEGEIDIEDLIEEEECVYTLTHYGYIKRIPSYNYKSQRRGGRGISAMSTREEDFVETLFIASTHDNILLFTSKGRVYKVKGYEIPESSRTAKGMNIVNLLQIDGDEKITAMIPIKQFEDGKYLTMVTSKGIIKKTGLLEYDSSRKGGIIAITLDENDELIRVKLTDGNDEIIIGTRNGKGIHFMETDVRPMGRTARGVRGIYLEGDDYVVGTSVCRPGGKLLTVTENGYGKRTDVSEYKIQSRGGKGVLNYNITEKTGKVAGIKVVDDADDIMLISSDGIIIRIKANEVSTFGRVAQGVRLMRLSDGVRVVTVARCASEEDDSAVEE